jgi:hypothetical protein
LGGSVLEAYRHENDHAIRHDETTIMPYGMILAGSTLAWMLPFFGKNIPVENVEKEASGNAII